VVRSTAPARNAGAAAIHRTRDRRERWPDSAQDFAYITIFAIGCGALGALGAALIELGVLRLFA